MVMPKKEFCKRGHPRTPENVDPKWLECKICRRLRQVEYRANNKEKIRIAQLEYRTKAAEAKKKAKLEAAAEKERATRANRKKASEYIKKIHKSDTQQPYDDKLVTRSGKIISGPTAFELTLYRR
jgi:acetyl-CoA carboxylase alpha subunit